MKTVTLSNEMKEILSALKEETKNQMEIFRELPEQEQEQGQDMWLRKMALIEEIECGHVIDESKAKKWLELIEAINERPITDEYYNKLIFLDDGSVLIQFFSEGYEDEFYVDFVDGKLILNDEIFAPFSFSSSSPSIEGKDLLPSIDYLLYHLTELDFLMNLHCR